MPTFPPQNYFPSIQSYLPNGKTLINAQNAFATHTQNVRNKSADFLLSIRKIVSDAFRSIADSINSIFKPLSDFFFSDPSKTSTPIIERIETVALNNFPNSNPISKETIDLEELRKENALLQEKNLNLTLDNEDLLKKITNLFIETEERISSAKQAQEGLVNENARLQEKNQDLEFETTRLFRRCDRFSRQNERFSDTIDNLQENIKIYLETIDDQEELFIDYEDALLDAEEKIEVLTQFYERVIAQKRVDRAFHQNLKRIVAPQNNVSTEHVNLSTGHIIQIENRDDIENMVSEKTNLSKNTSPKKAQNQRDPLRPRLNSTNC